MEIWRATGVLFGDLPYLLCIDGLSVPSFLSRIFRSVPLQMIASFTTQVFLQTFHFLHVVCKTVLKTERMSDSKLKINDNDNDKTELTAICTGSEISKVHLWL